MEEFFAELLEYNFSFNEKVISSLSQIQVPEKSILLINHTINAHEIWNARINGVTCAADVWEIRPLQLLLKLNHDNYQESLKIIENTDLTKTIRYSNTKGQTFENSVRDMLFHIINHSTYHRGQIATDVKNVGLLPLATDYIFYKREEL
ncbi:MAG: damage-inducible protein DinB [Flavobacterium sp.]|nr:MAG: damage-inducible protein DinB [Flavobacterium sp.]